VRQRAGVFESNIIHFFKASTFERQRLEQARRVALGKPFKGSNRRANNHVGTSSSARGLYPTPKPKAQPRSKFARYTSMVGFSEK
jgi:hypothetical protein